MRAKVIALAAVLLLTAISRAEGPATETSAPPEVAIFRVTAAEVHLTVTASRDKNKPVVAVTASDFQLLRDGVPVNDILSFRADHDVPLSAVVLTDVSDSMTKAVPLERAAVAWLRGKLDSSKDKLAMLDFGIEVESGASASGSNRRLTSLYDVMMETLPRVAGEGRRALILLSDGVDTYSYHSLEEVIATAQRHDIAVYAITAHPGKKQYYRWDLLERLCQETGGRYYEGSTRQSAMSAMAAIEDQLRNGYELVFRPGEAGPGLHRLTIRPADHHLRFYYRSAYFQPPATSEMAASR